MTTPPRLLDALLRMILPPELSGPVRGDLEEGWRSRVEERGLASAWVWYLGQSARLPLLRLRRGARRLRRGRWTAVHGPGGGGRLLRLWQDLRVGGRSLLRRPGFSAVVVVTLALSIGAATLVFSVLEAAFLRPLPYPDAGRIVSLHTTNDQWRTSDNPRLRELWNRFPTSLVQLQAVRAAAGVESVGGGATGQVVVRDAGPPRRLTAAMVDPGLFPTLGVEPALGRLPGREEMEAGEPVAVLSHGLWTEAWGAAPDVPGRTFTVDGRTLTVVGVMPPRFFYPDGSEDLWIPLPAAFRSGSRSLPVLTSVARLAEGARLEEVSRRMDALSRRLGEEDPAVAGLGMRATFRTEEAIDRVRNGLTLLMGAVVLVVLLAAVNLGNIVLSRASRRRGELALRRALGAGRAEVASALLGEVLILACVGGTAGVLGAFLLLEPFVGILSSLNLTPSTVVRLDIPVLAFAAATTLVAALGAGLPVALGAGRAWPARLLAEGRRTGATQGTRRTLRGLLVAETALAFLLLSGSGLLVHTVARAAMVDLGYEPEELHFLQILPTEERYPEEIQRVDLLETIRRRVSARPDLGPAVLADGLPSSGTVGLGSVRREEAPAEETMDMEASRVGPGYFEAAGLPILRGRGFEGGPGDAEEVVVSEGLARRLYRGEDPLGRRVVVGDLDGETDTSTVVGVVADARVVALVLEGDAHLYRPVRPEDHDDLFLMVRSDGSPAEAVTALREAALSVDPDLLLGGAGTVAAAAWETLEPIRLRAVLLGALAGLAVILAGVGVFGVMAHVVEERTREIGVRIALGAVPRHETWRLVRSFLATAGLGTGVGLVLALAASGFMEAFVLDVDPLDPWSYVGAATLLAMLAGTAAWVPARRAARVDPVRALSGE